MPQKPLIVPIFIPHWGCPHRCAFCNQSLITNKKPILPSRGTILSQVEHYLRFKRDRTQIQLAFFGGNFLGLKASQRENLLNLAQELVDNNTIHSIRFSTRPDTVTPQTMESLAPYAVSTVELGVQSMNDAVLRRSKRGHTEADTLAAASLLKGYGYEIGMQMMVGLPGDRDETALETGKKIIALAPAFVRIYPLIVLKKSLVHQWYRQGSYTPLQLEHCVSLVKKLYTNYTKQGIRVIRMGLQASEMLESDDARIAGPWHPAFGHLVFSELFYDKLITLMEELPHKKKETAVTILVHPRSESRLRGDKNQNLIKLAARYPSLTFQVTTDTSFSTDQIKLLPKL